MTVSFSMAVVLGMVVAGLVIGRQSVSRRELQSAADAAALAAAYNVQQNGLPFQSTVVMPFASRNTRLSLTPTFTVLPRPTENRTLVQVVLVGMFDSEQSWFDRYFTIPVTAYAQVNETVFGEHWPALSIVLDASESMNAPILGSATQSAYQVLRQVITSYAGNTLPVRNGLVVFNDTVVAEAAPPTNKVNNLQAIQAALNKVVPLGRTNTRVALRRAGQQQQPMPNDRNVILISDGEPTLGGPCAPSQACHFNAGQTEADVVRNTVRAALFAVEIRRTNFTPQAEQFLRSIAGLPGSGGNDPAMYFTVQSALGITSFLIGLTRGICAFGPLDPGPGAPPDAVRIRPTQTDLVGPPRRVFAFLRLANGVEVALPRVKNRDQRFNDPGFEYEVDATGAYVILTLRTCNDLGADANRRLVVRWDDAQLSPPP
jgi:hypothetical protein